MRVLPSIILCLFMALCVLANDSASDNSESDSGSDNSNEDFVLGDRKENDRLIYKTFLFRLPGPFGKPAVLKIPVKMIGRGVITQVKLRNTRDTQVTFTVLRGEIGERFLLIRAEAKPREILSLTLEVHGSAEEVPPATPTPTPNPTSPNPTSPNPTSPDPTSPNPTSPDPTSPNPTTVESDSTTVTSNEDAGNDD